LYAELLPARLAWEYASKQDLSSLIDLEKQLVASRFPQELREAATKLGARFVKTVALFPEAKSENQDASFFTRYVTEAAALLSRPVSYGVFCATQGIAREEALAAYLFAQTSGMVTNCVKTVPLSQSDGQIILASMRPVYKELLEALETLTDADLARSCPGLEIRSMQHERLYSRMYIS
jgi:urease accessory protein